MVRPSGGSGRTIALLEYATVYYELLCDCYTTILHHRYTTMLDICYN